MSWCFWAQMPLAPDPNPDFLDDSDQRDPLFENLSFGAGPGASGICIQKHQLSQERYSTNEIKRTPRNTTNEKAGEIPNETSHDRANAPTTAPN